MKLMIKQIREDISEALFEVISVEKVNKKLVKAIEKSSKEIAKKVAKVKCKEEKKAKKLAKIAVILAIPRVNNTPKLNLRKTVVKKPVAAPKVKANETQ